MRTKDAVGRYGEELAARYLAKSGFAILERNWRCELGEIDIVARDGDALVVCEVKTRRGLNYGSPLESITYRKLATLRKLVGRWLQDARAQAGRDPDRHRRRALRPATRRRASTTCGAWPDAAGTDLVRRPGRPRRPPGRGRGRHRPRPAEDHADRSAGRVVVRGTGPGPRRGGEQRRASSPTARSPSASRRPPCPRPALTTTSPSPALLLAAGGVVEQPTDCGSTAIIGELGLDGRIREVRGALAMTLAAVTLRLRAHRRPRAERRRSPTGAPASRCTACARCGRCSRLLRGMEIPDEAPPRAEPRLLSESLTRVPEVDLDDVHRPARGRRAIEAAAAGGHHLLPARAAGLRQDDAGGAAGGSDAGPEHGRLAGGVGRALAGRAADQRRRARRSSAVHRATPHGLAVEPGRWWVGDAAAGRDQLCASRASSSSTRRPRCIR